MSEGLARIWKKRSDLARGNEGFTLTDMLVAIAILGLVMAMVMVTVISFTQISVNTSRSYTSQDHDQLVIDVLGHYLPFVVAPCVPFHPFIQIPAGGNSEPRMWDPVEFFAQVGPGADAVPEVVAMWLHKAGKLGVRQEYDLIAEAAPIVEASSGSCKELPLWGYNDRNGKWGFQMFDLSTFSGVSGSVNTGVLFEEKDLTTNPGTASGQGFPTFQFCSAPTKYTQSGGKTGYAAYGLQIDSSMSKYLSAIESVRVEISSRIGNAPAATVVSTFRSLNYRVYGPAGVPSGLRKSGSNYVPAPCSGDETVNGSSSFTFK